MYEGLTAQMSAEEVRCVQGISNICHRTEIGYAHVKGVPDSSLALRMTIRTLGMIAGRLPVLINLVVSSCSLIHNFNNVNNG